MFARLMRSLLLLVFAVPAFAQSGGPVKSPAWALEFGLANASLSSYDGATISLRHQASPGAAWRFGFTSSLSSSTSDADRSTSGTTAISREENESSNSTHALSVMRLWFPAPESAVRPWFGAGLEGSWSTSRIERNTAYYDAGGALTSTTSYVEKSNGPGAGLVFAFGLEWNASERFVLHAQYGQAARWRRRDVEYDERQTFASSSTFDAHREGPSTDWTVSGESARAGVSVFW